MFDEEGNYKGYRGTGKDITARKIAEEALRQSKERLRELAAHQETIKERERKRIAQDLHDELGQTLLAIRLDAESLAERSAATHPDLHATAHLMLTHIDMAMKSVKSVINDLRPFVLDLGIVAAMEWQVSEFQRRSGIACKLQVDDEDFDCHLDEDQVTALFRIVQESLTNIGRHAKASQAQIVVCTKDDRIEMKIADNGMGFDPEKRDRQSTYGLAGIEERINVIGGTFAIDSIPGIGTALMISMPIPVPDEVLQ
jgi:signal transduction histidine kinase